MLQNSEQESVLQSHLRMIVAACLELSPRPEAILLYGGYGRGEGSWYTDNTGAWRPYNDYDIRVVVQGKVPAGTVRQMEKSLADAIGIRWVDIGQFQPWELPKLKPTILNYDFKNGSRVIYGDPAILDTIPDFRPSELTAKDGLILYFTRLYTLLGSFGPGGLESGMHAEEARFFRNQMAKALLAIADVLLLAKGAYDASYRIRVERVAQLFPEKEALIEMLRWAVAEKLSPSGEILESVEAIDLYEKVQAHFFREMNAILGIYFGRAVSGPDDVEHCMKWLPTNAAKRLFWVFAGRGGRMERKLAVMLAQSYIAASWARGGADTSTLLKGVRLLRQANRNLDMNLGWDDARLEAARLRMGQ